MGKELKPFRELGDAIEGTWSFEPYEKTTEEVAAKWIGRPVTMDGKQIGTITEAWLDDDRRTIHFRAKMND